MKRHKDWLEEVWKIKEEIARDTEKMSFKEYMKYIKKLAKKLEEKLKKYKKISGRTKS